MAFSGLAPLLIAMLLALFTIFILDRARPIELSNFRFTSIDGLRGYLAFFVFLHHSSIWYFFIKTGKWDYPSDSLYRYLGSGSVMMFFMITSFLFFGRLLDAKFNNFSVDFLKLYTSRIFRIAPLFFFSVFFSFLVSGYVNQWDLKSDFLKRALASLGFGIFGAPVVDSFHITGLGGPVMAGVLWTLPYEWMFYLSLPFFAVLLNLKFSKAYLIFPVVVLAYVALFKLSLTSALPFLGGMLVSILIRMESIKKFATTNGASFLVLILIFVMVEYIKDPQDIISMVFLCAIFFAIASGNSLFGLLNLRVSRLLGEVSYSIYLLHGLVLFILLRVFLGDVTIISLSVNSYWGWVFCAVPALICLCYFTFINIEKPFMTQSVRSENWRRFVFCLEDKFLKLKKLL